MEEAQELLLKNFRVGKGTQSACARWLTEMARDLLAPIPFREVFVILALFLPQLTFVDEATTKQELWSSPTVRKFGLVVDVTPTATGLQGMREYRVAFPSGSQAAIFCPAHFQSCNFEQLASSPSSTVHMGSQAGKAYRIVLEEHGACYSVLALLLAFVSPSRKRKGDESPSDKLRRLSSPRHWDVALVPFPEDFVPLPTPTETGLACPAPWAFPPSLCVLEPRATKLRVLAIAEAGDTVTADHLLQMACLAAEHKPTVLGIPGQVPIPYQLECTVVLLQSLHALFQLLTSGNTMQYCPQAPSFAVALETAARQDNGHIVSMAASLALALRAGRSTLAVAGVFGAGKTRFLTFLLAWLALTTHLKIAVVHKENPAGRAITKLLTAFDLEPDHQRYFVRPVSREEAETNTACTNYDLRASEAASYIPGAARGAPLSTPCTRRSILGRWIHSPGDEETETIHFPSGSTHQRVTWGPRREPIHFTRDDHHYRDVETETKKPPRKMITINLRTNPRMMPPKVPRLPTNARRPQKAKRRSGEVQPKKERLDLDTFSVSPVPTEHSSNCPQTVLTVARLYIEPTLKGESGPVGDPVVSDPMHPSGVHLSRDRTLTQLGRNRRSCPPTHDEY